jgi:methyl-accepting chemotaxis protein
MKISKFLTIAFGVIGIISIGKFGSEAVGAYRDYNTVHQLRALVELRGELFHALTTLSTERSLSQVLLASPHKGNDEIRQLRQDQIKVSTESLTETIKKIAESEDFAMRDELFDDLTASLARITELRTTIDTLTEQKIEERDFALVDETVELFKAEVIEMKGMGVHLVVENDLSSSDATLVARLQEKAFEMREYAGRARSHFAIATLNERLLTHEESEYSKIAEHRAMEAWNEVQHVIETINVPEPVLAQIDKVESDFTAGLFGMMDTLKGEMAAIAAGNPDADAPETVTYSISFDEYFGTSKNSLELLTNLSAIAGDSLDVMWLEDADNMRNTLIINVASLLVLLSVLGFSLRAVSKKVSMRLASGMQELTALSADVLDRDITHEKGDLSEIAQLTDGLIHLQAQLRSATAARQELTDAERVQQHVVQRLSEGLTNLAAGDLSGRITDRFDGKYQELADNFNAASAALSDLVSRVIETSANILSGARGINSATVELSQRTETQGVTLQNAAAALEQLTRNIVSSQTDATELDSLARLASGKGNAMTETMTQTVAAIESIKNSSQQIEQIVSVIEDIAFQTNLLALNAGVEATRAGVEGSGFAVIASEVRGLAERSAQSAQDIKALIAASGVEVAKGVEYVAEAESSAGDIGDHIKMISTLISRIAAAATEQSQGLTKVNDGVSQLDLVTQTNVAMVEETTAECASLSSVAQDLSQLVARFHIAQTKSDSFDRLAKVA